MSKTIGFTVIYRWELREDRIDSFVEAWGAMTKRLMAERGALGSRLHRAEDGTWVAYAQWPSKRAWEASQQADSPDPVSSAAMGEAILKSVKPILLTPVSDYLVAVPGEK